MAVMWSRHWPEKGKPRLDREKQQNIEETIMLKEVRMSKKYFVCKSINVLCLLMQKGFFPSCTKESEFRDKTWIWYFDTSDKLVEELGKIFPDAEIKIVD